MNAPSLARRAQVNAFAAYLRCVRRTGHMRVELPTRSSALVTLWHDAMFCLLAATAGRAEIGVYVREQPGLDDTLHLMKLLGIRTFISDNRNAAAVKAARDWLGVSGRLLAVTLDGGIPRRALPGVVRLSRMLRVPLHPLVATTSSGYRLDGWDRCVVPDLGARVSVRALEGISDLGDPQQVALRMQMGMQDSTLQDSTLQAGPTRDRLGTLFRFWPRFSFMPVRRGRLTVWPGREATNRVSA